MCGRAKLPEDVSELKLDLHERSLISAFRAVNDPTAPGSSASATIPGR
jgi:hypothetical protein